MKLRFYHCRICGKILAVLSDTATPTVCCGQTMEELLPNRSDGAGEKHVPVFTADGDTLRVRIGSEPHPMTDSHRIVFAGLRTARGFRFREFSPGDLPACDFPLDPDDPPEAVYAYCDLHGLWCAGKEAD